MIGDRLLCLRKQAGYSQKQVADALCVDQTTYYYYETGKMVPSISELGKLSNFFKVSMEELVKEGFAN